MWSTTSSNDSENPATSQSPISSKSLSEFIQPLNKDPYTLIASGFFLGVASALAATSIRTRYFYRFKTGEWITPDVFERRRWIKGIVTNVGDADNFRLYHTPGPFWRFPLSLRKVPTLTRDLKDQTLHVRMAGVDAPEAAHFGRPAQEYADKALLWLKQQIEGKTIYCQLIHRDQYSRLVAITHLPRPYLPAFLTPLINSKKTCLSLAMVRAGWGVTYELSGAEYGPWGKSEFIKVEAEARAAKRGIWEHGKLVETPAEYKKRFATTSFTVEEEAQRREREMSIRRKKKRKGWFSWLRR